MHLSVRDHRCGHFISTSMALNQLRPSQCLGFIAPLPESDSLLRSAPYAWCTVGSSRVSLSADGVINHAHVPAGVRFQARNRPYQMSRSHTSSLLGVRIVSDVIRHKNGTIATRIADWFTGRQFERQHPSPGPIMVFFSSVNGESSPHFC